MVEDGRRARRLSYTAMACWYGAALTIPAAVLSLGGPTPDGPIPPCTAANNCITGLPDGSQVLRMTAVFLAASLVIALVLRARLMRAWQLPIVAGTVATFTAWLVTALLYCLTLTLLARL